MAEKRDTHLYVNYGTFQDFFEKSVDWQIRQREDYEDVGRVFSVYAFAKQPGEHQLTPKHLILNVPVLKHPLYAFTSYANFIRVIFRLIGTHEIRHIWMQCHIYFLPLLIALRLFQRTCAVGIGLRADLDLAYRLGGPRESEIFLGSRRLAKCLERMIFKRVCDYVFPRSENFVPDLVACGVTPGKIVVQRFELPSDFDPGIDPPSADFLRKFTSVDDPRPVFSFVGRMTRYNFVYDILHLFSKIHKTDPRATLIMAGRGPEEEGVRRRVRELGLEDRVSLPGFVPRESVMKLRKMSDFSLCLMGGNSLLEAAALGSVVVAYDVDWHTELVTHMVNGIVVPEGRVDELFAAIEEVRRNPELKVIFAGRSSEIIKEKYSQHRLSIFSRALLN